MMVYSMIYEPLPALASNLPPRSATSGNVI
jgi:hypothetical protein